MGNWVIQDMVNYISNWWVHFYDPYYLYVFYGAVIIAASTVAAWYFNILKPIAGAIVFGTISYLVGFRKGQKAEDIRDKS